MTKKTVALIDADILCYEAAASCEVETRWDDDIHTVHSDLKETWRVLKAKVDRVCEAVDASRIVMTISSNTNFRKELVYPAYKDNRKAVRKPLCLADLKAKTFDEWETHRHPSLEGDDVLGILATDPKFYPGYRKVVVSLDKDLKTIPGYYYNFRKEEWYEIDEDTANRWHMLQTLTGDTTDGYPGCPGIGPKKAEQILDGLPMGDRWEAVVAAYEKAKLAPAVALQMARCAYILRNHDYVDGEVKLWTPVSEAA